MTQPVPFARRCLLAGSTLAAMISGSLPAAELPSPAPPPPPRWHQETAVSPPLFPRDASGAELIAPGEEAEVVTERYPNRAVKIRRTVTQDASRNYVNHGPWTMYDPHGQIVAQGQYQHGKRHGVWSRVLSHFPAVEPEFQGPYQSQAVFQRDRLHGTWTIVDRQQRPVGSWDFKDGVLDGKAIIWHSNGQQRQSMTFRNGQPDGEAVAWKQDGTVWGRDYYREGKQLVPVVTWHDSDQKESEGWILRSSFSIRTHVDWWNGIIEITRDDAQGEDLKVGKWTEWYANGALKFEGTFERGEPVGEHVWWHENGQKQLAGLYEEGLREGRWTAWHENGMKHEEGTYLAGIKDGTWTVWSSQGQVAEVQHLKAGLAGPRGEIPVSSPSSDAEELPIPSGAPLAPAE